MTLDDWRRLFALSDRHGFVIAADECYSEVYFDEDRPPLGALAAATCAGTQRLFASHLVRQPVQALERAGLRSGYVAGDAALVKAFLLYRTYHGSAMSPAVAAASLAAWKDEDARARQSRPVRDEIRAAAAGGERSAAGRAPDAAFYLWAKVPGDDAEFARRL